MKAVAAQPGEADRTWVQQVLDRPPRDQGVAAGTLRGKLLRREMTNVSPAELLLRDELLKLPLNQTLERSPSKFADFQTAFIQATLGIPEGEKIQQIHDIIEKTYQHAVVNGLDIPSKPAAATDEWVGATLPIGSRRDGTGAAASNSGRAKPF